MFTLGLALLAPFFVVLQNEHYKPVVVRWA